MSTFQRMRRVTPWKPQVRPGRDPLPQKTPQFAGSPGWILLSHNDKGTPEALFVTQNDTVTPLSIIVDDRLCSDTVLRVTRLSANVFVVCDIRWLNGINIFETMTYKERHAKLGELLDAFHSPDLTALVLPADVPATTPSRGWETYDDTPGSMGVFIPA